jgi:hypothetical protein
MLGAIAGLQDDERYENAERRKEEPALTAPEIPVETALSPPDFQHLWVESKWVHKAMPQSV